VNPFPYNPFVDIGKTPGAKDIKLFFTNLPRDATERELSILFRFFPGFVSVKLSKEGKLVNCYAEFDNEISGSLAMQYLQGFKLDMNSNQSGIIIEYDRGNEAAIKQERSNHTSSTFSN